MLHAVVHYPRLESSALDAFRAEHDPFADLIAEHLTLVFPVPLELERLRNHVRSVSSKVDPFGVRIGGLSRTWDHWLCLEIDEGYEEVIALHDRLYTGPLETFLRTDLPYEPHIGIGFFGDGPYDPLDPEDVDLDTESFERARAEAAELATEASRRLASVSIVSLDPDANRLRNVEEVELGSRAA